VPASKREGPNPALKKPPSKRGAKPSSKAAASEGEADSLAKQAPTAKAASKASLEDVKEEDVAVKGGAKSGPAGEDNMAEINGHKPKRYLKGEEDVDVKRSGSVVLSVWIDKSLTRVFG
jgi:DNA ligase-1